jgi:Ca2+-binding RTX toxin-like protein
MEDPMRQIPLETLELRTLLSASLDNGVLTVTGTDNAETIQINPLAAQIIVDIDGAQTPFTAADVTQINIDALGGADTVTVNVNRPTRILAGAGADNITGSDGGNDDVFGNTGADTFSGRGGDDRFTWNPGDGNDQIDGDDGNDTHVFNGSNGAEIINVTPNGSRVTLTRNLGNIIMDIGGFENVVVNALGASDVVSGAVGLVTLTNLTFNGGDGDDQLNGGDGIDQLNGDAGNDLIDGNRGNDVAHMGDGDDTFVWDPGDGSDLVEGEAGFDTLRFNGSNGDEIFDASANGSRLRFTRNVGNIVMDVGTTEKIDLRALGGNDQTTIHDLSATDVRQVVVDAGEGNDTFAGSSLHETFLGGGGDDSAVFGEGDFLDMGAGTDELVFFASSGNDNIHIDRKSRGGNDEVIFHGNVGNQSAVFNNGETITVHTAGGRDKVKVHKRAAEIWDVNVVP